VGDAFVRGVSGGERKRVSLAEMMATRAHVSCWDNSTRAYSTYANTAYLRNCIFTGGLDASTAVCVLSPIM